jgi:fluoride ion exporter CrcB/FEX
MIVALVGALGSVFRYLLGTWTPNALAYAGTNVIFSLILSGRCNRFKS